MNLTHPTADTLDELAAFGNTGERAAESPVLAGTLTELVQRNPLPVVLVAAAAGAGLMALVSMMSRRDPGPLAAVPLVSPRVVDYDALKRQIADLVERLGDRMTSMTQAVPVDAAKQAAKQRVGQAGDAIADSWSSVRQQAVDALGRFEPQATAALKVARENPVWTALVVGAIGALLGSQMLGSKPETAAESPSDPSADA